MTEVEVVVLPPVAPVLDGPGADGAVSELVFWGLSAAVFDGALSDVLIGAVVVVVVMV